VTQTGPSIVNAALPPTSPSSPRPKRNALLALVLGVILGTGLAFLRDRLDDKIKSPADVEASSGGLPIVGTIPIVEVWRKVSAPHIAFFEDTDSNVSEAYRTLRTSIQFLGLDHPQHVIGITSSIPTEGKSTAAANLAVSFARAGQRVVVVSCDFRRPRLHEFFGFDNEVGATSVLLGQSTLTAALRTVPDEPNLRVLTSGPVPPNPAEILSLDRVRQLINVLATNAEMVLLDCPPVLPVTDSLLISRLCDSMLVIGVAAVTKKGDLRRTFELLAQVQAPVRGTILNRMPPRGTYAGGYGYGYGYGYSKTDGGPAATTLGAKPVGDTPSEPSRHAVTGSPSNGNGNGNGEHIGTPSTTGESNGHADDLRFPAL
jgi:capsular exopolysaccharide synthesis family protein